MKQIGKIAAAFAVASACLGAGNASADQGIRSLKDRLVGAWHLASIKMVRVDGSKYQLFNPDAKGIIIFEGGGHYSLQITRMAPPVSSTVVAAEGSQDDFEGTIAHFGTYTVNDKDRSITFRIESSSVPEWNGTAFKRSFAVLGNRFAWFNPNPTTDPDTTDSRSDPVWKRAP
jgi:hypothetical protein